MMTIDPDEAHVFGVLMATIGATVYLAAFSYYRKYRQFVDTVTSAARSVAEGFVRVEGHAMGEHNLVSPMFQVPCLYFALRIIGVLDETRNPLTYSKGVKFYLQDETGKVLVDPTALRPDSVPMIGSNQVSLTGWKSSGPGSFAKSQAETSSESPSQPIHIQTFTADFVASYLAAHPLSVTARMALLGGGEVRLEERVIAPYQHYVIQGTCVDNPYAREDPFRNRRRNGGNPALGESAAHAGVSMGWRDDSWFGPRHVHLCCSRMGGRTCLPCFLGNRGRGA
jgi:hypothetical protein